jgi:hypothetical protein
LELGLHLKYRSRGPTIWVAAAEREDAGRFIVRADEKLTASGSSFPDRSYHFVVAVWKAKDAQSATYKSKWFLRNRSLQSCNNSIIDGDLTR